MKPRVLIVEDNKFFRDTLRDILKNKYSTVEVDGVPAAKEVLSHQKIDVVLSDIQMPQYSGIDLLEWTKSRHKVPVIIMTGFSMLLETQSAFELGAKAFLTKPFKTSELVSAITSILQESQDTKHLIGECEQTYCKVSIDEFVAKPQIDFDVYIKLSDTKVIKIANKGQEIPRDKVEQYKSKGVRYLYILKEDFGKLIEFNMGVARLIKDRDDISIEKKMNFLKYTGETILEKTFVEGVDKTTLYETRAFLDMTMSTLTQNKESLDLLNVLNTHSDHLYAHALGVTIYAIMIAREIGFTSNSVLFKLSIAGLFHDIGKKEIDKTLTDKPRYLLSSDERKIIESHVVRSQEILEAMGNIPTDAIQVVLEHHEEQEGLGFPYGKKGSEQHPLSKILQCANIFVEHTLPGHGATGKPALGAIEHIERVYGSRVDRDCLAALRKIFKGSSAKAS
ncbi:MAG: response regulator [Bdellovibrionales bacterium]|nr:response regulator [Bdellovibrionales bacterium]